MRRVLPTATKPPMRFPRPTKRAGTNRQAVFTWASAAVIIGIISLAGVKQFSSPAPVAAAAPESGELYTGTIQLAPSRANRCRRMTFDNRSGGLEEGATVPCGDALEAEKAEPPRPRLELVREGFRNR